MPTYSYRCSNCNIDGDMNIPLALSGERFQCPNCETGDLVRVFSPTTFVRTRGGARPTEKDLEKESAPPWPSEPTLRMNANIIVNNHPPNTPLIRLSGATAEIDGSLRGAPTFVRAEAGSRIRVGRFEHHPGLGA